MLVQGEFVKSVLQPSIVKALTNNTELIHILNRFGHGISYTLLMEAQSENAYNLQSSNCALVPDSFTIFVANNTDRQEETCQVCVFWLSLFNVCFHSLSLNYIYAMCSWLLPIIVLRKNVKGVLVSYTIQFLKNLIRKEILKFYRQGKTTFRTGKVFR